MTDLEILRLDAIDRAERKLREIGTHPSLTRTEKWKRLLEAIRDDAFADLEDLVGGDLPFNAYWDEEEPGGTGWMAPGGSPPWWPIGIYWPKRDPKDHSFWQGKFAFSGDPKTSKKRKRLAWTSRPPMYTDAGSQDRPSPAKIAATPKLREAAPREEIERDDREIEEMVMAGVL